MRYNADGSRLQSHGALFFRLMITVANENIFLVLLRDQIYGFHQSAEKASETSMTTTPMVSLTGGQRLRIRIWPISQQGDGLHNGVTGVRTDQRAVIQYAGNGRYRHASPARYITNGDHIHCPV